MPIGEAIGSESIGGWGPADAGSDCSCCGPGCLCNPCAICDGFLCNAAVALSTGWVSGSCNCNQLNGVTPHLLYLIPGLFAGNVLPAWISAIIQCDPPSIVEDASCSGCAWYAAGPNGSISGKPLYELLIYYDYSADTMYLIVRINNNNAGGTNCGSLTYSLARQNFLCEGGQMPFTFVSQTGTTCNAHPATITVTTWGSIKCCQSCGENCGGCQSGYPNGWSTYLTGFSGGPGGLCNKINNYAVDTASVIGFIDYFGDYLDSTGSITGTMNYVGCMGIQNLFATLAGWSGRFYLYDATAIDNTWKIKIVISATGLGPVTVIYSIASGNFNCKASNTFSLVSNSGCAAVPATLTINPSADLACHPHPCCPSAHPPPSTLHATITDGGGCSCIDPGGGLVVPLTYQPQGPPGTDPCPLQWSGSATCTCTQTTINVSLICMCPYNQTSPFTNFFNGPQQWALFIICSGSTTCGNSGAYAQSCPDATANPTTAPSPNLIEAVCTPSFQLVFEGIEMNSAFNQAGSVSVCCPGTNGLVNVAVGP